MSETRPILGDLDLEQGDPYIELERQQRKQPIFKIPNFIKERNVKAYEPQMVSIGPYHYGKPHLKPMEPHKRRAVVHFLRRQNKPIQAYKLKLMEVVDQLKGSYEQLDDIDQGAWKDDNRFIELMMLDGCFTLEFLSISDEDTGYSRSDPLFSYHGRIANYNSVMQDLLVAENQLPVLNVHRTLSWMMFGPGELGLHFLDTYMRGLLKGGDHLEEEKVVTHSASELHKFGVQFRKVASFQDIRFDKYSGIVKLPSIIINEYTITTFLNLIALELRVGTSRELNSYIRLLSTLIRSDEDVSLLQSQNIIFSNLDSNNNTVVEVIKMLNKDTIIDFNDRSNVVRKEMYQYYELRANDFWRRFRQNWASISVGAATFLLVLTVVQTLYAVLSFHYYKN